MNKEYEVVIRLATEKILELEGTVACLKSRNAELESIISSGKAENARLVARINEMEREVKPERPRMGLRFDPKQTGGE